MLRDEHAISYPLGHSPGEKYCEVISQPEGRQALVLAGPRLRNEEGGLS
jgi:hypothetical protein